MAQNKDSKSPNQDMSLRDQFAQYGFGRKVAEVMTDPSRDADELVVAAAHAGMDVVFGENHNVFSETMRRISNALNNAPDQIKAIVLEAPIEVQPFLEPDALSEMPIELWTVKVGEAFVRSYNDAIEEMYSGDEITQPQYDFLKKDVEDTLRLIHSEPDIIFGNPVAMRDMAIRAAEKGVPVIAGDVNRRRGVAFNLTKIEVPENIKMMNSQAQEIINEGLDDTSDIEHLKLLGIDLTSEGIIIAQRGFYHISDKYNHNGFDDVLEREYDRNVVTFSVHPAESGSDVRLARDPVDFLLFQDVYYSELDRGDYTKEEPGVAEPLWSKILNDFKL